MKLTEITAASLEQFFIGGCGFLALNKEIVDALNVFPVPDGDTGTNMSLTMNSAVKGLKDLDSPAKVAQEVSKGALMGARGNSGVILSQLFRGFAQGVGERKTLKGADFAYALYKGVELAYKSVMKPVEGTILTVSKAVAGAALKKSKQTDDVVEILTHALEQGQIALNNTPNLLPVLKQAGVVDAGGKGFLLIIEGGLKAVQGEPIKVPEAAPDKPAVKTAEIETAEILFQYCTEFILKGAGLSIEEIRGELQDKGDSLLVVGTENLVKVHIHTNHPGKVLEYAVSKGSLHDIKIDNMKEQHRENLQFTESVNTDNNTDTDISHNAVNNNTGEENQCGVVAVVAGEGLVQIFKSLGVTNIINGGQTMNPSAEDLLTAINKVPAKEIVILPNNRNIILTAEQAKSLSEKPVTVVKTKSFAQGLAAMLAFDQEEGAENNREEMTKAFAHVKTGEVTFAVRDSSFNGFTIKQNDIMGLADGSIEAIGQDLHQVVLDLLDKMVEPEHELITMFYGHNLTEDQANIMQEKVAQRFSDMEVEVHFGGQPLYYYLISVE
ncbi:MAG: DAK2 domain-containing protein [Bacillota bacterium]|nr:DAK2 domain-containing protein [Clostridia bacterium]